MAEDLILVYQDENGRFFAEKPESSGSAIQGSGASVLEAVGAWAIYANVVRIRCQPPAVLNEFTISNRYTELRYNRPISRAD